MSLAWQFRNVAASVLTPTMRLAVRYGPRGLRDGSIAAPLLRHFGWHRRDFVARSRMGFRFAGNAGDVVARYVYYFGIWEPTISEWVASLPLNGRTVIDVGANLGWYSLLGARCVGPAGKVVAVEASPTIVKGLERNIAMNGFANVRVVNAAAWNCVQELPIFHSAADNTGETTVLSSVAKSATPDAYINAAPLRDLLLSEEITTAGLVKIDVEGAEREVIEGMADLLPRFPHDVRFLLEMKPNVWSDGTADSLLRMFRNHGFRSYVIRNEYNTEFYQQWFAGAIEQPIHAITTVREQADLILTREQLV